ncbi:DnaJ-like subfamily C member 16 [Papilio machaon]|uniref:DnaJ homolog subfamily C member 16 n=1 Tax=Papilio machaon TaxID=76193 RepID=A0A194QR87_PAPMA|nr:DnaJ-like subfamily C member 16 [Papilio machaon]
MQWTNRSWSGRRVYGVLLMICALAAAQDIGNPYEILGVHRRATLPEIRKAYRQLAKEWHPDKNEDPNAESRFVEIKQAYELLTDMERRQAYDLYGITNEDEHMYKQRHDYSQYARFRHFENHIMEKSVHTPALVLFYTDWCFDCVRSAAAWRRLVEALQPLGITLATVHAGHEAALARRVGVHGVPCLTLVIDKQVYIYKESLGSMPKILETNYLESKITEFIRWKFPYKLVVNLNDYNVDAFVSDFEDNRVKALIFEERPSIRLRYLITAFHYRERVSFAFVDMTSRDSANVTSRFKVQRNSDSMVLLKEDSPVPAASVSTAEIPTQTLRQLIDANRLLTLPRLSSQVQNQISNDPFEEFFGTHFRTQDQDITLFHKLSVTARHFENHIMEKSVHTPALVLFYTDWCFDCVRSAAAWRRLVEALQPLGITLATVHAGHEAALARRVGVHGVPCLTLVIDKQVYIYKESLGSMPKILESKITEFIRWKFPYKLVVNLNDYNVDAFVSDFEDNRVKALIFEERPSIRLRYLITAFHYRERVSFAFVDMTSRDSANVTSRFKVQRNSDSMVLLKEDSPVPAASVSTAEIPTQTLRQLIDANRLLTLPRLSSQVQNQTRLMYQLVLIGL